MSDLIFEGIYPCLDDDVLVSEVENGFFYKTLVTYFSTAVSLEIHYKKAMRSSSVMACYRTFEVKYINFLKRLYENYCIYSVAEDAASFSLIENEMDFRRYCIAGFREENMFRFAIPELHLLIHSCFDLKLVLYWPKGCELSPDLIRSLEDCGINYE